MLQKSELFGNFLNNFSLPALFLRLTGERWAPTVVLLFGAFSFVGTGTSSQHSKHQDDNQ
jgi:hypothetical protein